MSVFALTHLLESQDK